MAEEKQDVASDTADRSASRSSLLAENRHLREQLAGLVPLLTRMVGMQQMIVARLFRPPWWKRAVLWLRGKARG